MPEEKIDLAGPFIKIHSVSDYGTVIIQAEYTGPVQCPDCSSQRLRTKDRIERRLRHASLGTKNTWLHLTVRKYGCLDCGRYFRARVPGLLPYRRSMEMFPPGGLRGSPQRHLTAPAAPQPPDRVGDG